MEEAHAKDWREGIAAYEAAISNAYAPIKLESSDTQGEFRSAVANCRYGLLNFSQIYASAPFRGVRKRVSVAAGQKTIIVMLTQFGSFLFSQRGREAMCEPGTIVLMDAASPIEAEQLGEAQVLSVNIPTDFLKADYRDIEGACAMPVDTGSGWPALLRNFIESAWREGDALDGPDSRKLPTLLSGFLGPVFMSRADQLSRSARSSSLYLKRIEQIIDERLQDPDLVPQNIADTLGVSLSYLYAMTRQMNTTVGRLLLERRLEKCRTSLGDPSMCDRAVTDIALAWGFQDLSHFSRRFRERFGNSPTGYRDEVLRTICAD